MIGGQQLAPMVHSAPGRAVLALPGLAVRVDRGELAARVQQVASQRPSYINALLIQSRGVLVAPPCAACARPGGMSPFPECRRVPGHFGGCCANCKWRDHAARCTTRDNDSDDDGPPPTPRKRKRAGGGAASKKARGAPGSTPQLAITVD